ILGGQPRNYLGRLNADGTLDNAFNPGVNTAFGTVSSLAVQPDGKMLVGGGFTAIGGRTRYGIARLNNAERATQSLNHDGSTIQWLRGGTSPEVWRTSFEQSSDGLVWMPLGDGTRIPTGWRLEGVSLPVGSKIRARGYISGSDESSGWF